MSLDWGLDEIKDWKKVCYEPGDDEDSKRMSPVTNSLIWETMTVGIGRITEKNWEEFARRLHVSQQVNGGCILEKVGGKRKERFITPGEVRNHIGLHTNASPKTSNVFMKDMYKSMVRKANFHINKESSQ